MAVISLRIDLGEEFRFGPGKARLIELIRDPDPDRAHRSLQAMFEMKKIDIAALEAAANGA